MATLLRAYTTNIRGIMPITRCVCRSGSSAITDGFLLINIPEITVSINKANNRQYNRKKIGKNNCKKPLALIISITARV